MEEHIVPDLNTFVWQPPVKEKKKNPPISPSRGDRYLVGNNPNGDWVGHEKEIAQFDGSSWKFIVPSSGMQTFREDISTVMIYDKTRWKKLNKCI